MAVGPEFCPVDLDAVHDAIALVELIHGRLTHRHGEAYRQLEKAIERLAEPGPEFETVIEPMIGGGLIVHAPQELTQVIIEARRLGVIAS